MAKNDNLKDLLTDVADAIREKKGTTELINPQDFGSEIRGLESGGSGYNANIEGDSTIFGMDGYEKVIINEGVKTIGRYALAYTSNLKEVHLPNTLEVIEERAFFTSNITEVIIPDSVHTIVKYAFATNIYLQKINIPKDLTAISMGILNGNYNINVPLFFPKQCASIDQQAFNKCKRVPYFNFANHETIPNLSNINAFTETTGQFVVPDSLYDEWIVATNWATYADRIVKASEFVEPTNE